MAYDVVIKKRLLKVLENINEPDYSNVKAAIYNLSNNPRPHGYKKLKDRDGYRIRQGDYRIIYEIFDKQLLIDVIAIGHRKEVYD